MKKIFCLLLLSPCFLAAGLFVNGGEEPIVESPPPQIKDKLFDPEAVNQGKGVWLDGELLLWRASEDGLDYAIKSDSQTQIIDGHVKSPDFDWDWGLRLGLGIKLPHDQWDLFFGYTYIQGHGHGSVSAPTDGAVFPLMQAPFGLAANAFVDHAHASWNANVNIGDVELGRNCIVGRWLSIRPFFGVRGLTIDQDLHVDSKGGTAVSPGDEDQVRSRNDFWGIGLRVGVDTLWGLGAGWGIYGNGAASLVSGNFSIEEKETLKEAEERVLKVTANTESVVAIAELALGIQWDHLFSKDRYHFGVKFGWEFNVFFDQNRLVRFVSSDNPGAIAQNDGDLSFQGLTVGFRFDF